jgi:alkylhydroperoxidase family enzyme
MFPKFDNRSRRVNHVRAVKRARLRWQATKPLLTIFRSARIAQPSSEHRGARRYCKTNRKRLLLVAAGPEAVTRSSAKIDSALMARVKKFFDDDAIVELTALIAFQNLSSKFNASLGVAPQGFCRREVGLTPRR